MKIQTIKNLHKRIIAIGTILPVKSNIPENIANDFFEILDIAGKELSFDLKNYKYISFNPSSDGTLYYDNLEFRSKFTQIKYLLESFIENEEENIVTPIGDFINLIKDKELKTRCIDLLASKEHFDRPIREATTILEDRIRSISGDNLKEVGVNLVDKVLNPDKGLRKIEGERNEQDGYYQIFRGIMMSFRNETHHRISDNLTREDAMKIVAFIDSLLSILDKTTNND